MADCLDRFGQAAPDMLLGTGMCDSLRCHADDFARHQLVATALLHGPGNELVGRHALARQFGHRSLLLWLFPRPRLILALAQIRTQGLRLPLAACCKLGVGGLPGRWFFHSQSFHGSNSPSPAIATANGRSVCSTFTVSAW